MDNLIILDTTLRDGEQAAGAAMKPEDKILIAEQLERLRVDVIEAGFPAASAGEAKVVGEIAGRIKDCRVSAFCRGVVRDIELAGEALKGAGAGRIEVALPVSDIQREKMNKSRDQILELTEKSVALARKYVSDVQWIGTDCTRADYEFLRLAFERAIKAGAKTVSVADTVGYATPEEITRLIKYLVGNVSGMEKVTLSIHCHDDLGLATANTLAAVNAGAREAQCTVNGLGERAGNAALEEIVMATKVRKDIYPYDCRVNTREFVATSRLVSRASGFFVPPNKSVVGTNAFNHGSGIHQDAILKSPDTYEIISPESVGAVRGITIGPHSGRHGLRHKMESLGFNLSSEQIDRMFVAVKETAVGRKSIDDDELRALGLRVME